MQFHFIFPQLKKQAVEITTIYFNPARQLLFFYFLTICYNFTWKINLLSYLRLMVLFLALNDRDFCGWLDLFGPRLKNIWVKNEDCSLS